GWDGRVGLELPDDKNGWAGKGELRTAAGAWDGIATHHLSPASDEAKLEARRPVLQTLGRLAGGGGGPAGTRLCAIFLHDHGGAYADAILEGLTKQEEIGPDDVRPHARWLVQSATHREPLKLGIVLLGAAGTEEDLDDLVALARHDEFTLFA